MRLTTARAQTQSSPVNSINNIMLWLESTSEKSFINQNNSSDIQGGDKVRYWKDIAVRNLREKTVGQATTANQPLYVDNSINGLPAVRFDVTNDNTCLTGTLDEGYSTNNTVFFVMKYSAYNAANGTFLFFLSDSNVELNSTVSSTGISFAAYNGSTTIDAHTSVAMTVATPVIMERVYNRANNTSTFYRNGVLQNSTTAGLVPGFFSSSLTIIIANHLVLQRQIGADFGEIIMFDRALKTEERQAVEQYLSKKWGIKLS